MEKNKRDEYFIFAEILACASFILNTISVVTLEGSSPIELVPKFDFIYQLKTILAFVGIFCFFLSRGFSLKLIPWYIRVLTIFVLLYSIPIINMFLVLPVAVVFRKFLNSSFGYREMIISQIIWGVPFLAITRDVFMRVRELIGK